MNARAVIIQTSTEGGAGGKGGGKFILGSSGRGGRGGWGGYTSGYVQGDGGSVKRPGGLGGLGGGRAPGGV